MLPETQTTNLPKHRNTQNSANSDLIAIPQKPSPKNPCLLIHLHRFLLGDVAWSCRASHYCLFSLDHICFLQKPPPYHAAAPTMLLRKEFSLLRKRVLLGVQPKNLLLLKVKKIGIPDETTINKGTICVVSPNSLDTKHRLNEMKSCFFLPLSIVENGLNDKPLHTWNIKSVQYNDTSIKSSTRALEFRISRNKDHLFFCYDNAFVDKMAVPRNTIDKILFSPLMDCFLIILHKRFGQIMVRYEPRDDEHLLRFFQQNEARWGPDCVVSRVDNIDHIYSKILKLRELLNKDPQTLVRVESDHNESSESETQPPTGRSSPDLVLKSGLPSLPTPTKRLDGRATRSATRSALQDSEFKAVSMGDNGEMLIEGEDDEPKEQEVPAPFDPPLKHALANGKKFAIAYNDFKTLYNNDWINDTLIDFFIAYEIDKAVSELKLVREDEVYAFNSFFFTKLMSKPEDQEGPPDYYANIQRWLSKVDLMSYQSVIIPINEHLHWYCCIIKDLPKLLRAAKRRQIAEKKEQEEDRSNKGPSADESPKKPDPVSEVFVFDSLRHRHPNIEEPLRKIIDQYAQDTYGVPIPADMIKFTNARVPQQRNFNDCGIHVICNVGKWLSEPVVCERMWRKMPKNSRGYFNIGERLLMRKKLIDLLLELHLKQPPDESNSGSCKEEDESDDEIELISYFSSKPDAASEPAPEPAESTAEPSLESISDAQKQEPTNVVHSDKIEKKKEPEKGQTSIFDTLLTSSKKQASEKKEKTKESPPVTINRASFGRRELDDAAPKKPKSPVRTLDPRANQNLVFTSKKEPTSGLFLQIEHPQIRRLLLRLKVKPHTVDFLNLFFRDHNRQYGPEKQLAIQEFVNKFNFFDPSSEYMQSELLISGLKETFKEPAAPMEEPFVIQDADDSNGELNRSVGDLRINSDNPSYSEPELEDIKQKLLRSDGSDLEILDDKWRIVSNPDSSYKSSSPKSSPASRKALKSRNELNGQANSGKGKLGEDFLLFFSSRKALGPKRRRLDARSDSSRRADKSV